MCVCVCVCVCTHVIFHKLCFTFSNIKITLILFKSSELKKNPIHLMGVKI